MPRLGRGISRSARADLRAVNISDFAGKPLIISLIYTSCYHTCPVLTQYLARAVAEGRDTFGDDAFSVITIGFDTENDTPSRMAYFARQQEVGDRDWVFASTDRETIDRLAKDLGFIFSKAPQGFDHLAQTTIIDDTGVVYTQVYGQNLSLPSIMEPLKQLIFGRAATAATFDGWLAGVKLFCTVYDPKGERYLFDYSLLVRIAIGILSFLVARIRRRRSDRWSRAFRRSQSTSCPLDTRRARASRRSSRR